MIVSMACGVVAGGALQLLWQVPSLARAGFAYRPRLDLHHPGLRQIGRLMLPAFHRGRLASYGDTMVAAANAAMAPWREKLFAQMHHNASAAAEFLQLPNNAVVELGSKIEI